MSAVSPQPLADRFLRVKEITERTGYSKALLLKHLGRDLPCIRVGRTIRVRESDLERWLEAHRVGGYR